MSSLKRKTGRGLLYGENTVQVNIRVPESKKDEILDRFYEVLNEYILSNASSIEVKDAVIESFSEKKLKPADVIEKPKESLKVKRDYVVSVIDIDAEKKAKIAMLKEIASGTGPKTADSFISSKKVPLEEKYEFEEGMSLPDIEYRVAVGTKGNAFVDMYNSSLVYLKFEGRTLLFNDRKEFDRFVKTEGVIL